MSRISCAIFFTVCLLMTSGCRLLESAVSDVQGWDISACVDGFGTCWELWRDNADKFDDGFVEAMGSLVTSEE